MIAGLTRCEMAFAQASLKRVAIKGMPAAEGLPNDPDHPGVEMVAGPNRVIFDSWYGGVPRFWYVYGQSTGYNNSIIWPHMGAAMQIIVDTGQDYTQGTANGVTPHYLRTLDSQTSPTLDPYYIRETIFQPPINASSQVIYKIVGIGPAFWISHEAIEDAIPNETGGINTGTSGWSTGWVSPPIIKCSINSAGAPVIFHSSNQAPSGILMLANSYKPSTLPWDQRLCEIDEGKVAFKVEVDLTQASSHAIGGIMFRRDVKNSSGSGLDKAFRSTGYFLNLNRSGDLELVESAINGTHLTLVSLKKIAPQASSKPILLEVRTHNQIPQYIDILIDNTLVYNNNLLNPSLLGPHFGLYAFSDPNAPSSCVRFAHRQVFDMGLEFVAQYSGDPSGYIECDVTVRNQLGVTSPHNHYPTGIPGPQFNTQNFSFSALNTIGFFGKQGEFLPNFTVATSCGTTGLSNGPNPNCGGIGLGYLPILLDDQNGAYAHWIGDDSFRNGLYVVPVLTQIDGKNSSAGHSNTFYDNGSNFSGIGITPLPMGCVTSAQSLRLVTRWGPNLVAPLMGSDCNGNGITDICDHDLSEIFIDQNKLMSCENGSISFPFDTVLEGYSAATTDDTLTIKAGNYRESMILDKPLKLQAIGGLVRIGNEK